MKADSLFSAPIWQSAFRPFYLVGVIYGLGVMGLWLLTTSGVIDFTPALYSLSVWHGHEMIFGFSGAVVAGFILTALPGWAGTKEIDGWRLALLVLLWFLGRIAVHSGGSVPAYLVLILDSSMYFAFTIMVLPGLMTAENKHYLALLPILIMLCLGNVIFHLAVIDGDMVRASWAIQIGLMAIVVKFILAGGYLATVFTGNALRQKNGLELSVNAPLEYLSAVTLGLFIYGALAEVSSEVSGGFAFLAAAMQLVRFLRWRTLLILDAPLVLIMHLSYLWFIAALILFGAAPYIEGLDAQVWLHAFTVGALSLMMLSLITRVALRHTGRSLIPARAMILSFILVIVAAVMRLMISLGILTQDWLTVTAAVWLVSFAIYILVHGLMLIRPSLPKRKGPKARAIESA